MKVEISYWHDHNIIRDLDLLTISGLIKKSYFERATSILVSMRMAIHEKHPQSMINPFRFYNFEFFASLVSSGNI